MSSLLNLPEDQFNFLTAEIISLCCGCMFHRCLEPNKSNVKSRHLVSLWLGVFLSLFCFGFEMLNLLICVTVSYLFMKFLPRQYVQLFTFVFLMAYLSGIHLYYQFFHYSQKAFDISSPMMILVQKLTLLAFSYNDGIQTDQKLNADQKFHAIKQEPTLLEFFSFSFNFQSILVGPTCLYNDYIDFINGNSILKHQMVKKSITNGHTLSNGNISPNGHISSNGHVLSNGHASSENSNAKIAQPSNFEPIIKKFLTTLLFAIVYLKITPLFPYYFNSTKEMYDSPMWFRVLYLYISAFCHRCKYYLAWVIADLVSNASGLGFNGYDEHGKAKWDLVTGVNIFNLETSTSVKYFLDNWNITTQAWLRRIAYDRLKTGSGKTLGVFVLSAFWHGFYPGYYFTFIQIAFTVYGGRKIRKVLRPYFQRNLFLKNLYGVIGWINTLFIITYASASFVLLEFKPCVEFYNSFYWIGHLVTGLFLVCLPLTISKETKKLAA